MDKESPGKGSILEVSTTSQPTSSNRLSSLGLLIWLLAALFFLYEFFLRTIIGSIAPQIIPSLHLTVETFALLGTVYAIGYGGMQVPAGLLLDHFGLRKVLALAIFICSLATFTFAFSQNIYLAFIARLFMGAASSFAFLSLLAVVFTWFSRRYYGFFTGFSQLFGTMGPLLAGGPLIMLMTTTHIDWRVVLIIVAGFGLLLALLTFFFVRNKGQRQSPRSIANVSTTSTFKAHLLLLFKNPQVWFIAGYSGANYVSIALLGMVWGVEYLQANGFSQQAAATTISLCWIGYAVGCPLLGILSDLMKRRKPSLVFCALLGFVVTVTLVYLPCSLHWVYGVLLFLLGVAASGQNIGFVSIAESVGPRAKATALGINNGMISVFDAFTPALVGLFILHISAGHDASHLVVGDFTLGLSIMPFYYLVAVLLAAFFIKETYSAK